MTKEGDNVIVNLLEIVDHKGVQTYSIETVDGRRIEVHSHNLEQPEDPDIASIPMSASYYVHESRHIIEEQEQYMAQPNNFSSIKQRFFSWHKRLNHIPKRYMFQLIDQGILLSEFVQLKSYIPLCVYCIYGKAHRKDWRTYGKKSEVR